MYKLIPCKTYNQPCYQMSKNNNNIPPGLLQYKVTKNDIINIDTNSIMILMLIIIIGNLFHIQKKIY